MNFLADQDVYAVTVRFLTDRGHDVTTAAELGLSQATDAQLLQAAQTDRRLLVTRDRDFGNLVFVGGMSGGVIYLRVQPATLDSVHQELNHVISRYQEQQLANAFVVVEPGRHRFRRLSP